MNAFLPNPSLPLFSLFSQANRTYANGLNAESRFRTLGNGYVQSYQVNPVQASVPDKTVLPTYQLGNNYGKLVPVQNNSEVSSFSGWLQPGSRPGTWHQIRPVNVPAEAPSIPERFQQQASFFKDREADLPDLLQQPSFRIQSPQSDTTWLVTTNGAGDVANVELVLGINPNVQPLYNAENRPQITTGATFVADPSITGELTRFFPSSQSVNPSLSETDLLNLPLEQTLSKTTLQNRGPFLPLNQVGLQNKVVQQFPALNAVEKRLFGLQPPPSIAENSNRLRVPVDIPAIQSAYNLQTGNVIKHSTTSLKSEPSRAFSTSEEREERMRGLKQFAAQEAQKQTQAKIMTDLSRIRDGLMPAPYPVVTSRTVPESLESSMHYWHQQVHGVFTQHFSSSTSSQGSMMNLFSGNSGHSNTGQKGEAPHGQPDSQPSAGNSAWMKKRLLNTLG